MHPVENTLELSDSFSLERGRILPSLQCMVDLEAVYKVCFSKQIPLVKLSAYVSVACSRY